MRFIPFLLVLSTENAHKFFTFWLPSKSSHMPSSLVFFHGSDVLQPMLVSYDFISHLMCH